ncbi:type II toxin-antitoxin system Phd/YefM family antitoxin [Candidatus Woesebacteria bacterium]|nr:type II toxin-antitoxin system Phd/YefM family antitoxin [Candidatus Woesebacteria bacterium]
MDTIVYTASEARKNLYSLIKAASKGIRKYESKLRSGSSVVLLSKDELDSWFETLDILSNKEEPNVIRGARKEKATISHKELLEKIGM